MAAFLTLKEAAELEDVDYDTMQKRVRRSHQSDVITKRSETGGRDIVLVSTNSLSKIAQARYQNKQELKRLAESVDQCGSQEPDGLQEAGQRPWYVDADYEWYQHQFPKRYYAAVELGNVIREYYKALPYYQSQNNATEFTDQYAMDRLGKSGRTFRRLVEDYHTAEAWAVKLEKENGCSYEYLKVLALCRKPKVSGLFPSIPPEVKQCIKNIWFNREFAQNRRTREDLYETLQEIAKEMNWNKLPSYQTVVRYIAHLMDQEGMASAHAYAKDGAVSWKNKQMVKRARDTKSLQVLEMVQGDEHTFDLWVMYKTSSGKEIPIRPKLVCWIDTRSRMIMGDMICRDANAQILKESLIKMFYEDLGGYVPKYLYIDNGKDYTAKEMIGVDRKDRHDQEARSRYFEMECDRKTRGFYHDMGIVDEHISMPYEPWTKGQIERSFGTAIQKFSKRFASYTGTLTGSRTDSKVPKDIKRMAERGELLTMEEFWQEWLKWKEKYINRQHSSLKRMQEEYTTPKELFEHGQRYRKPTPPRSVAIMALMKSEEALVRNVGILRKGYYYMADELLGYINKKVMIKVDPHDVSSIYVMDQSGKMICQAYSQELLKFGKTDDEVLQMHRKQQKRQLRAVREALAEATKPFDGDETAQSGYRQTIGGIDLTIGHAPKKSKVVQMTDKQTMISASGIKKARETSAYMDAQAQKALGKLRELKEG